MLSYEAIFSNFSALAFQKSQFEAYTEAAQNFIQGRTIFVTDWAQKTSLTKVSSSYYLCIDYFSQLSFDSEMYTKSAAVADFVYTSESNESWEKHSKQR